MKSTGLIAFALMAASSASLLSQDTSAMAAPAAKKAPAAKLPALPKGIGGAWTIDPQHSTIGFSVRHSMAGNVIGAFDEFSGTINVNEKDISKSSVDFTAKTASIDTKVKMRDDHLRSPVFFDAAKYPEITFKSSRIVRDAKGFRALGTFTMHGVSKQIVLPFVVRGPVNDGWGSWRTGISSAIVLDRRDYGVAYNQAIPGGGVGVGNFVNVNLELEAIRPSEKKPQKSEK